MKPSNTFTGFLLFSLIAASAFTEPHIDIVGNVYCCAGESQLPIGNITIELKDIPSERTRTKTSNGYYRIRGPFERLYNHNITVVFRIGKRILREETAFILPDSRLRKRDGSLVYKMDDVRLDMECAVLKEMAFDNIRNKDVESEESKGYEALASPLSFLRYFLLLRVVPCGAMVEPTITRIDESDLPIESSSPINEELGLLLQYNRTVNFPAFGFRYSPSRALSPSLLTNPSALCMEPGLEISMNTRIEFKPLLVGNIKLVGNINTYWSSFQGWMIGSAYYVNIRELPRDIFYDSDKKIIDEFLLQEHAVLLAIARRVTDKFALGITGKLQIQGIEIPSHIHRTDTYGYYDNPAEEVLISQDDTLITDSETRTAFDVDMSSTFDISPRLRIGAALLNIVGTKLIETDTLTSNRGFGVGTTFFFEQVQLGADLEFTERMGLNESIGVSYVPCENLEFACGFMSRNLAIQTMVKYRSLLITYQYSQRGHKFTVSSVLRLPT